MKKENKIEIGISILLILGLFTFVFSNLIKKPVTNLDELWNYNTARAIMNGLIPYKQISMITTPLLPTIVAIILKITIDELIVFRILNALLATSILFMTYKILNTLTNNRIMSLISTGLITYIYYDYFFLDYNFTVLLIGLIIEYLELKRIAHRQNESTQKKYIENDKAEEKELASKKLINVKRNFNFIIGILAGLAICTKQTLGVFITVEVMLIQLLFVRSREGIKQYLKNLVWRVIGIAIPCSVFAIFLLVTGSLQEFIGYAVLGIKTFNNSISYTKLFENSDWVIVILSKVMPIFLIMMIIANIFFKIKKKSNDKILLCTFCALPMLITMYPIADNIHFFIGILQLLILLLYEIILIGEKIYNKIPFRIKKYILIVIEIFLMLLMTVQGVRYTYKNFSEHKHKSNIEHYKFLDTMNGLEDFIERLKQFREEKNEQGIDAYILDAEAVVYTLPQNTYTKNYDMFLKGNIGKNGEDGIIEDIKNSNNCIYLIKQQGRQLNWQTPTKVLEFVRNNLDNQGTIGIYEVYFKE